MSVVERRVKAELDAACRERGARADPSRHAFMEACAWSGILFSASPTRQDCLPTPLYLIRIAYLLGRIPAHFASALGMSGMSAAGAERLVGGPVWRVGWS